MFNFTKWYADAAWPEGEEILYRARVSRFPVGIGARINQENRSVHLASWRTAAPVMEKGRVTFPSSGSTPERNWTGTGYPPLLLFEDDSARVEWEVIVGNGIVSGTEIPAQTRGYVERLHMTGWPWRLGLSRLYWGRFCGNHHSLVWIAWEGRINRRWCLLNGVPQSALTISLPGTLKTDGLLLEMHIQKGLVDGPIRDSMGHMSLPGAAGRFLSGRERKWTCPATLSGELEDQGHVIHEVVEWI